MLDYLYHATKEGSIKMPQTLDDCHKLIQNLTDLSLGVENDIKEKLALKLINGVHIEEKHGWDGYHDNFYVEVKSETQMLKSGLIAKGNFNNLTFNSLEKYKNDKGILMFVGYTRSGSMQYAIACDMKYVTPLLEKALFDRFPSGVCQKKENINVNISIADLKGIPFEVIFYPDDANRKNFSRTLRLLLENNVNTTKCGILSKKVYLKNLPECSKKPKKVVTFDQKMKYLYGDKVCYTLEDGNDTVHLTELSKMVKMKTISSKYSKVMRLSES